MKKELLINMPKGIDEVVNASDILSQIDDVRENEIENTRWVLMIGIRKDGSLFSCSGGFASSLEVKGLQVVIQDVLDDILELGR